MTAKEMFEELGYELVENSSGLKYQKFVSDILWVIYFDIRFKFLTTAVIHDEYETYHVLDMNELKAINKQCEELGWL